MVRLRHTVCGQAEIVRIAGGWIRHGRLEAGTAPSEAGLGVWRPAEAKARSRPERAGRKADGGKPIDGAYGALRVRFPEDGASA